MRVAVFCGSSSHADPTLLDLAGQLGAEIARRGHTLIYGGGRTGLMGALANATLAAGGAVQGVILRQFPLPGHPLRQREVISLVVAADNPAGA